MKFSSLTQKLPNYIRQEAILPQEEEGVLPNFLIIGAMRSGTTSLARYLGAHPDVYMALQKEVHFFDRNYSKGIKWYKAQFSGVTTERAVGEATPLYIYQSEVLVRMVDIVPEARLIVILRNPVDRAYSHYWHSYTHGKEQLTFEEALAAEAERLATEDHLLRAAHSYVDRGYYLRQLQLVCELYPREKLHVILYEDLCDAPVETFQSVCRFLVVADQFIPPNVGTIINSTVAFHSVRLRALLKYLSLPPVITRIVGRLNTRRGFSYPPMNPETRSRLLKQFAPDNAALAAWLERDLSIWNT